MSDYGQMPSPPPGYGRAGGGYPQPNRGERPPSVETATRLMLVRATISLISIIITFATSSQLKHRIARANPSLSRSAVDTSYTAEITTASVFAIAVLVFYVFLAFQVRAGRNWARITTWVFAGLGVLGALFSLAGTELPVTRILALLVGVLDLAIIVLLAQGASNRYFKPQYQY